MRRIDERRRDVDPERSWHPTRRTVLNSAAAFGILGGVSGASATALAQEEDDDEQPVGFDPGTVRVARGDVAYISIAFEDDEEATLIVGSEEVNYVVQMDVHDGDGDGTVTVALNTAVAGWQDEHGYSTVDEADEVRDVTQETEQLNGPLEAATYQLRLYVDDERVDVGQLVLEERETRGMRAGIAPRDALPGSDFLDWIVEREEVAQGDWAVFGVGTTGIFGTVSSWADLRDDENGLVMEFERTAEHNLPAEEVQITDGLFGADEENDRFFVAVDTTQLEADRTYEATFRVTADYPIAAQRLAEAMRRERIDADELDDDERAELRSAVEESVAASVTVLERTVDFDVENDELSVTQGEETISGTTTVAPGSELLFTVTSTTGTPFVDSETAEVGDDGTWEIAADFSDIESGTEFIVEIDDPSESIEGTVE